jgi:cell division septation protein DedD
LGPRKHRPADALGQTRLPFTTMFYIAVRANASRGVAAPRVVSRTARQTKGAVTGGRRGVDESKIGVTRASTRNDGAVMFTSADFEAGGRSTEPGVARETTETVSIVSVPESTPRKEPPVMAAAVEQKQPTPVANTAPTPATKTSAKPSAAATETSLVTDLLGAFSSQRAVETINGRVAMAGFVTAISAAPGTTLASQLGSALVPVLVITAASLAPRLRKDPLAPKDGITENAEEFFVFKSGAEMLNGRAAMVGLTAWWLVELVSGNAMM